MRRAVSGRRGGRSAGSGPTKMIGVGALSNPRYMQQTTAAVLNGTAAGFFVAILMRPRELLNTNAYALKDGAAEGWKLQQRANATVQFSCANGVGVFTHSPAYTLTPDLDKIVGLVGVHDGTNVRLYANRAEVSTGTVIVGYTVSTTTLYFGGAGSSNNQYEFFGCVGGPGVPSLANIQAWFDAVKAAKACAQMPVVPGDHMWKARSPLAAPLDSVGSNNLTLVGSGHTLIRESNPVWAW